MLSSRCARPATPQLPHSPRAPLSLRADSPGGAGSQMVAQVLREAGIVGESAADAGKAVALFCSSEIGLTSMVRQLEPDLHIDGSTDALRCGPRYSHRRRRRRLPLSKPAPVAQSIASHPAGKEDEDAARVRVARGRAEADRRARDFRLRLRREPMIERFRATARARIPRTRCQQVVASYM